MAIVMIIAGSLILFGSFVYAILNMTGVVGSQSGSMYQRHGLAMVGMLIGGLIFALGLARGGWQVIQLLLRLFGLALSAA